MMLTGHSLLSLGRRPLAMPVLMIHVGWLLDFLHGAALSCRFQTCLPTACWSTRSLAVCCWRCSPPLAAQKRRRRRSVPQLQQQGQLQPQERAWGLGQQQQEQQQQQEEKERMLRWKGRKMRAM